MCPQAKTLSRTRPSDDARHLMRYLRFKAGTSPADLAKAEKVNVKAVMESIRRMEAYEGKNSEAQLLLTLRSVAINTAPVLEKTLTGLLNAKTTYETKNSKTGEVVYKDMPDKVTQLEAARVAKSIFEVTIPKGPGIALQVNQSNQTVTSVVSKTETTEERMRRLRQRAQEHNLLPREVAGVPESMDKKHVDLDDDIIDAEDDDNNDDEEE